MPYQLDVWTDGACRGNGQPGSIGGAGVWFSKPLHGSKGWTRHLPAYPPPTNQRAELTAVILALELAAERRAALETAPFFVLTIHTDSKYVIGCLCDWREKWVRNGWCTTRGYEVVNRDLIETAANMIEGINDGGRVEFLWVPREENEEADGLANVACDEQ